MPDLPNTEIASSSLQRQTPDALLLYGFWYRALPSDHVNRHGLRKTLLLGIPLVLGRDRGGRAFAFEGNASGVPIGHRAPEGGRVLRFRAQHCERKSAQHFREE